MSKVALASVRSIWNPEPTSSRAAGVCAQPGLGHSGWGMGWPRVQPAGPGFSLRAPGVEGQLGAHRGTQPTGGAGQPQVVRLSCRRRAA